MKIERQEGFSPIVITLQTRGEAAILKGLIGPTTHTTLLAPATQDSGIEATDEDAEAFQYLYTKLDDALDAE